MVPSHGRLWSASWPMNKKPRYPNKTAGPQVHSIQSMGCLPLAGGAQQDELAAGLGSVPQQDKLAAGLASLAQQEPLFSIPDAGFWPPQQDDDLGSLTTCLLTGYRYITTFN